MEENKKSKKGLIIGGIIAAIAIIAVVVIVVVKKKGDEGYRIIKVMEVEGTAVITREGIGEINAYENMVLESGDNVCLYDGSMTLKLDEDKFIYLEPDTEIVLKATGTAKNSKTTIDLKRGAMTNEIQNKLSDESTYEINSANSTMAVRGTIFYVSVYEKEGTKYTKVSVFDGTVASSLVYKDGTEGDEVSVSKGLETTIYQDDDITDYLVNEPSEIDYRDLPTNVLKLIVEMNDDGRIDVETDIINNIKEILEEEKGPFTVTFMYNGKEFGTQTVEKGECATAPTLMPAQTGSWDFDFSTPITADTEINWK